MKSPAFNQRQNHFSLRLRRMYPSQQSRALSNYRNIQTESDQANSLRLRREPHVHLPNSSNFKANPKSWIAHAIAQLNQIDEEAKEEGIPSISNVAKSSVKRLLFALGKYNVITAVYPSIDGEIAIYFKSPYAASALLILVNNEGEAICYSSMNKKNNRKRYADSSNLPDELMHIQMRELSGNSFTQNIE